MMKRFFRNRSGAIGIVFALAAIPLVLATGAAIDFGRAYLVKTRLASALDAAGLAVGSSAADADLNAVLRNYFNANFPDSKLGSETALSMTNEGGEITLSAAASVDTVFLRIISQNEITVSASAKIIRETKGLEVVLVLDNTGSMRNNDKIGALRVAAQDMVDVVFGDQTAPDNLLMGLVPFVTTVNIGNGANIQPFVRFPNPAHEYPPNTDAAWKGCVEARPSPFDVRDTYIPGDPQQGEWAPYFWEAETYFSRSRLNTRCENRWWEPSQNPNPIPQIEARPTGRRDAYPAPTRFSALSFAQGIGGAGTFRNLDTTPPFTTGPNKACPQRLTPLTNERGVLEASIAEMEPWSGNGTMVNLGAVWGWRVLSPQAPFTEGASYEDDTVNKVMVILTDGQNFFSQARGQCTGTNPKYTSHYTGYGYVSERRLGTAGTPAAVNRLDDRLAEVCTNIKQAGVTIYTITFQLSDIRTQNLFRACASDEDKYFNSPSNEELRVAFRAIGAELSNLRIAR